MLFYTYMWLREDGTPYYVGKGCGDRAYRKGAPPRERVIIQPYPCEADAFAAEIFLIAFYGRRDLGTGILRNLTDGGEGGGFNPSAKTRALRSQSLRGNQNFLGHHHSEEAKRKIGTATSHALLGHTVSVATRQKIKKSVDASITPELRKLRSAIGKRGTHKMTCSFIGPDGQNVLVKGIKGFCREHGLSYGQMCRLRTGAIQTHQGWRASQ